VSERVSRICEHAPDLRALIDRLVAVSTQGLPAMLRPDGQGFAHTRRRSGAAAPGLVGISPRYGAIVLLGVRHLPPNVQRQVLGGQEVGDFCSRLLKTLPDEDNLGNVALFTWAAAALGHPEVGAAARCLKELWDRSDNPFTVEAAWTLSALVEARETVGGLADADRVAGLLLHSFGSAVGVFPHRLVPSAAPWHRSHIACFADQVYPIQALSRLHAAAGRDDALAAAARCAEQICRLQGPAGQWWWHYDRRTGEVVEGYPVYSVHQDSMAPMALLELEEAGGPAHDEPIRRGLRWLLGPPEMGAELVDEEVGLIWRKVARAEPNKLTRALRTASTRLRPGWKLPWLDGVFPPSVVEYESRPYHLGWVLFTWCEESSGGSRRQIS